jgi:hypothetical protein
MLKRSHHFHGPTVPDIQGNAEVPLYSRNIATVEGDTSENAVFPLLSNSLFSIYSAISPLVQNLS